jgi:hypothetical protein
MCDIDRGKLLECLFGNEIATMGGFEEAVVV